MKGVYRGVALGVGILVPLVAAWAQSAPTPPVISLQVGGADATGEGTLNTIMKITLLVSAISFAPAAILTMTCFTRIAVVLGLVRQALGTTTLPPNMVITGLALFLTFIVMQPVFDRMYSEGIRPYLDGQMSDEEALRKSIAPLKQFLVKNAREKDLALFLEITKSPPPTTIDDIPFHVAVPAFVLTELNIAFQIGFLIALPFLVLDMVVSSILTSMSMITLPPVVISLPLKLMLFVIVDGWHLLIASLMQTYTIT